jgi:hypothetical protein
VALPFSKNSTTVLTPAPVKVPPGKSSTVCILQAPNIIHSNTLAENLADIQEKDRYHVILANPPFGGKERNEVQQNFPIRTGETASFFLCGF